MAFQFDQKENVLNHDTAVQMKPEHIRDSSRNSSRGCAIALALNEHFHAANVTSRVFTDGIDVQDTAVFKLSPGLKAWISRFDDGLEEQPIKIILSRKPGVAPMAYHRATAVFAEGVRP